MIEMKRLKANVIHSPSPLLGERGLGGEGMSAATELVDRRIEDPSPPDPLSPKRGEGGKELRPGPLSPKRGVGGNGMVALLLAASISPAAGCTGLVDLDRAVTHPPVPVVPVGHPAAVPVTPVAAPMTLPRFLGIDNCLRRLGLAGHLVRDKAATIVPALAPGTPVLPISHPANADSPSPVVANAHKLHKAKINQAAKFKAIATLADTDCAANPLVEEALLAALDDPSPEVRIAAIEAVRQSRRGCDVGCSGCCSAAIRVKLTHIVFDKRDGCCYCEPSSKARRLARLTLDDCGGPAPDVSVWMEPAVPTELPPPHIIEMMPAP